MFEENLLLQNAEAAYSLASDLDEQDDNDDQDDKLVMADTGEEEEDREDAQEEVYDSSSGTSDESQDGKIDRFPGWRKKSQRKMDYGKKWILSNLVYVSNSDHLVSLSHIEKNYLSDCQKEGQEPLLLSVLARLLHQLFPEAGKCRLGPRKNQKIHYSRLNWHANNPVLPNNSATAPLTPVVDERTEKTPFEGSPSPQMQGDGKEPQPIMSGRGLEKREHMTSDIDSASPVVSLAEDKDEGEKECPEAAVRLKQVLKKVSSQGKQDLLLKTFAHSASCHNLQCTSLCLMFRRVRRHVVTARHPCQVLRIYSAVLRLHVTACVSHDCGLPACPALRASRHTKRGLDEEQVEAQHECVRQPVTKRPNVQENFLSTVLVSQPTLPSSPESQPSSPLLPPTPPATLPLQIMFVPVQSLLKPDVPPFSNPVGA